MDVMYDQPVLPNEFATKYSSSEDNSGEHLDRSAGKKLRRKCDLHVLPTISLLYLLAFIDRVNIGNARIQGLEEDLKMKGHDYNVALFVFFIPYILFEIPRVVTICQGVTQSYAGLIVCRFLLGLFEAGFVPGERLLRRSSEVWSSD
ncbi:MAG: hypothetical protein LQ347_001865 [Umbilicaria vellea]|nr:MAG: hypothetical protein LQ347_001865 [Umbilicaria vellea]